MSHFVGVGAHRLHIFLDLECPGWHDPDRRREAASARHFQLRNVSRLGRSVAIFLGEAFDVVFMVTVLGEAPDRQRAVTEAARVLRRGGRLSITEAAGDPDRVKRDDIESLVGNAGLVAEQSWAGLFVEALNYRKPNERG